MTAPDRGGSDGPSCSGNRRNARHRRGDLEGAEGGRLQGRGHLRGNDEAAAKFKADTGIAVYKWDVSSYDACCGRRSRSQADLGPIEILVNNAGITRDTMFHRMKPEQWNAGDQTNLDSLFNMSRPVIEGMRERKFGRIINISSINGQKGQIGQTNYSAAKAGRPRLHQGAGAGERQESGITVNAICPGYIATEMVKAVPKDVWRKTSCR